MSAKERIFKQLADDCDEVKYKQFFLHLSKSKIPRTLKYYRGGIRRAVDKTSIPLTKENLGELYQCLGDECSKYHGVIKEGETPEQPKSPPKQYTKAYIFKQHIEQLRNSGIPGYKIAKLKSLYSLSKEFKDSVVFDRVKGLVIKIPDSLDIDSLSPGKPILWTEEEYINSLRVVTR